VGLCGSTDMQGIQGTVLEGSIGLPAETLQLHPARLGRALCTCCPGKTDDESLKTWAMDAAVLVGGYEGWLMADGGS